MQLDLHDSSGWWSDRVPQRRSILHMKRRTVVEDTGKRISLDTGKGPKTQREGKVQLRQRTEGHSGYTEPGWRRLSTSSDHGSGNGVQCIRGERY